MPVARRDLRQHAEDRVAQVPVAGNQLPGTAGEEAVRLRVVELTANDRQRELLELVGVHLIVARHHRDSVHPLGERALVAGDDRRAHATVALVRDHLDPGIVDAARPLRGRVARGVVDDEDSVDEAGDPLHRRCDQSFLVVRRYHDGDALSFEHPAIVRL